MSDDVEKQKVVVFRRANALGLVVEGGAGTKQPLPRVLRIQVRTDCELNFCLLLAYSSPPFIPVTPKFTFFMVLSAFQHMSTVSQFFYFDFFIEFKSSIFIESFMLSTFSHKLLASWLSVLVISISFFAEQLETRSQVDSKRDVNQQKGKHRGSNLLRKLETL